MILFIVKNWGNVELIWYTVILLLDDKWDDLWAEIKISLTQSATKICHFVVVTKIHSITTKRVYQKFWQASFDCECLGFAWHYSSPSPVYKINTKTIIYSYFLPWFSLNISYTLMCETKCFCNTFSNNTFEITSSILWLVRFS